MLEVLVRIICTILMIMAGYYTISNITGTVIKKLDLKTFYLLAILTIFTVLNYHEQYNLMFSISVFLLNILIYKILFHITIEEAITSVSIFMIVLFLSDVVVSSIFRLFISIETVRENMVCFLLTNSLISIISILLLKSKKIRKQMQKFFSNISSRKIFINSIFLVLLVADFCLIAYNWTKYEIFNINYLVNLSGMLIFGFIGYTYIKNINEYNQLSNEYDSLFAYIQNFEDWIEKEQLNRHEYKNQLAVLRCLTKEKKVKDKIDEILEDNINIEGQTVTNLKNLPKGGIKGLMYYKASIAQKQKINLITDVSLEKNSMLTKLSEKEIKVLCKLIGIYFDNAIEAAAESRKKNLTIEVYELKDKVSIVISNSFKRHTNLKDRNKKGISSKGEGRGNGLYFASKLIKENPWLEEKQEIIDGYYIEQLIIKNDIKK